MGQEHVKPPTTRGMTVLRRELFRRDLSLILAELNDLQSLEQVYKLANRNDLFNMPRIPRVVNSNGKKGILLATRITDPDTAPSQLDPVTSAVFEQAGVKYKRWNLGLSYDYWTLKDVLRAILPRELGHSSRWLTLVGSVAVLRIEELLFPYKTIIGKFILDKSRPRVRTVVCNRKKVDPTICIFDMEVIGGIPDFTTNYVHRGCRLQLDVRNFFWDKVIFDELSPTLYFDLSERQPRCDFNTSHQNQGNLSYDYSRGQAICDVFSGDGMTAVKAAKEGNVVFANESDAYSYKFLEMNTVSNALNTPYMHISNVSPRDFIQSSITRLHALRDSWDNHTAIASHPPGWFRRKSLHKTNGPFLQGIPSVYSDYFLMSPDSSLEILDAFRGLYKNKRFIVEPELPEIHLAVYCHYDINEIDPFRYYSMLASQSLGCDLRISSMSFDYDAVSGKTFIMFTFTLPRKAAYM